MIQGEVSSVLSEIGLSEPEVAVYLATLESGSRPASIIAKKARLKRGHTYNVLGSLIQKGIIQVFVKNGTRYFTSSAPDSLVSLVEHRELAIAEQKRKLVDLVPKLQRLANPHSAPPKVRFFQGVHGVREIFEDTLKLPHQPIYGLLDLDYSCSLNVELRDWMVNYAERRTQLGICYYGIIKRGSAADVAIKTRPSSLRKLKAIEGIPLPIEIVLYPEKVAILSTHDEMIGLIVESKNISDTLTKLFMAVWNVLPEY